MAVDCARDKTVRRALIGLDAVMAVNAAAGAWYALAGARDVPREWLEGTPFGDYRVPGAILGVAVGGSHAAAAIALLRRSSSARPVSAVAGGVLLGWIAAQVALIGYRSPLQPAVFAYGMVTLELTRRLRSRRGATPATRT